MTKYIPPFNTGKQLTSYFWGFICVFGFITGNLTGATILVGPPPASIQTAINGASNGDTIQLSAGTYVEEIQVISKTLNIVGAGIGSTTIQALDPLTHLTNNFSYSGINYYCIVMVDNQASPAAQTVNISQLTVDGDHQQDTLTLPIYGNSNRFFAIGYHNANGTVDTVRTTSTRQYSNFNELAGGGIISAADTAIAAFNATNSTVDNYQRIGIDCRGATLTANITNNIVTRGYVLTMNTTTATPNGIQFSGSTTGSVFGNTVTGNIATVPNAGGSGIILFGSGANVTASGNTVNNNDVGIVGINCGNNLMISSNRLNFTTTPGVNEVEGILVQDTSGLTTISGNIINNMPNVNMDLSSTTDQTFQLMDNQINGSQTGLLVTGNTTLGPQITMNHDSFIGTSGYYIQEVTAPHNIWPSTSSVTFDGLLSGHITMAQFDHILTKIYDQHNDPTLGLVLDYITPSAPTLTYISPTSGLTSGGNTVTITGTSFISSDTTVNFGAATAPSVVVVSDTTINATSPAGIGTVDVTVSTPFGTTPVVPADQFTYLIGPPLPPSNFNGVIKTQIKKSSYVLIMNWTASPSNVILYRIYKNNYLVDEILASFPLNSYNCLDSKLSAAQYHIVAVNADNEESIPVPITIVQE